MNRQNQDVPRLSYALALIAGLSFTVLLFNLIGFLGALMDEGPYEFSPVAPAVAFALAYSLVGGGFGLVWPEPTWRWGVWLSAAPVCVISVLGPNAVSFAGFVALTLVPSSACAYLAARLHLKYVEVR